MTKRTFKRIQMLYEDGNSLRSSIEIIIRLAIGPTQATLLILEFYKKILPESWGKEIENDPNSP